MFDKEWKDFRLFINFEKQHPHRKQCVSSVGAIFFTILFSTAPHQSILSYTIEALYLNTFSKKQKH